MKSKVFFTYCFLLYFYQNVNYSFKETNEEKIIFLQEANNPLTSKNNFILSSFLCGKQKDNFEKTINLTADNFKNILLKIELVDTEINDLYNLIEERKSQKISPSKKDMLTHSVSHHSQNKKQWTILIYIAGDNDLYRFALRNIEQMKEIGSSDNLNIVIHFDFHQSGKKKETKRLYIEKGKIIEIGKWEAMDSGKAETLTDAARFALSHYPSDYFGIVFWNHGSGDISPFKGHRIINPNDLFFYNPETREFHLDRSINFFDYLERIDAERGVCYDNTTNNFLDDQKITESLQQIVTLRGGKKIDIILMDACLMGGIGTMTLFAPFAHFLAASEEVVLGPGYNYNAMLKILHHKTTPLQFIKNVVEVYYTTYNHITQDFCEAAINLNFINELNNAINEFISSIINFSYFDNKGIIKKMIKMCANKEVCMHFEEQSYIDLINFFENIKKYSKKIIIVDSLNNDFYQEIEKKINKIINAAKKCIIISKTGKNMLNANGISIYFPTSYIHKSFQKTIFGEVTQWINFLKYTTSA